jgi:L-aspartate oxidase
MAVSSWGSSALAPLALPHRYLVAFDPRDLPHHFTDVLVIGGGLAGLRAALGIAEAHRVLVVTKEEVRESNSTYAQGGIAGVLDPEDRFDDHIADTLAAGKGLCDPDVVALVVREAPTRIAELMRWGTHFDEVNGSVALAREGGHSHARIVHALGDATGREVMRAVLSQARSHRNVRIWQNSYTVDLVTHDGQVRGALVWDRTRGPALVWAPGNFTGRPRTPRSPRPTATLWPIEPAPSCATWSSCSSTPPSSTSPARPASS